PRRVLPGRRNPVRGPRRRAALSRAAAAQPVRILDVPRELMRAAIVLALAACGRIDFAPLPDAGTPRCTQWSPFDVPVRLADVASAFDDWGAEPSRDGLDLYMSSWTNADGFTIARWHRPDLASPFGDFTRFTEILGGQDWWVLQPHPSPDG